MSGEVGEWWVVCVNAFGRGRLLDKEEIEIEAPGRLGSGELGRWYI